MITLDLGVISGDKAAVDYQRDFANMIQGVQAVNRENAYQTQVMPQEHRYQGQRYQLEADIDPLRFSAENQRLQHGMELAVPTHAYNMQNVAAQADNLTRAQELAVPTHAFNMQNVAAQSDNLTRAQQLAVPTHAFNLQNVAAQTETLTRQQQLDALEHPQAVAQVALNREIFDAGRPGQVAEAQQLSAAQVDALNEAYLNAGVNYQTNELARQAQQMQLDATAQQMGNQEAAMKQLVGAQDQYNRLLDFNQRYQSGQFQSVDAIAAAVQQLTGGAWSYGVGQDGTELMYSADGRYSISLQDYIGQTAAQAANQINQAQQVLESPEAAAARQEQRAETRGKMMDTALKFLSREQEASIADVFSAVLGEDGAAAAAASGLGGNLAAPANSMSIDQLVDSMLDVEARLFGGDGYVQVPQAAVRNPVSGALFDAVNSIPAPADPVAAARPLPVDPGDPPKAQALATQLADPTLDVGSQFEGELLDLARGQLAQLKQEEVNLTERLQSLYRVEEAAKAADASYVEQMESLDELISAAQASGAGEAMASTVAELARRRNMVAEARQQNLVNLRNRTTPRQIKEAERLLDDVKKNIKTLAGEK